MAKAQWIVFVLIGSIYVCLYVLYLLCISKRSIVKATAAHVRKVVAGETKASIQSGICKQTAVGRVEADERWVDSDELNMLSNSELESHFLLRQRWNHNFAYETLFLFLFGFVCFYFFFWVTTKGFLHAKLFTRSALRSAISIESTLSVSGYLGRVDGALTHTHARVVPGIVQEVNKIKKQSKLLQTVSAFNLNSQITYKVEFSLHTCSPSLSFSVSISL